MFNVFKKILQNKEITEDELDKIAPFVMCRWLAGNPNTLQLAQFLNLYSKIPIDVQVKFLQSVINGKIKYIPYIKGQKTSNDDLELISEYFNISFEKALMYSEFITKQDLKEIKKVLDTKNPAIKKSK
jgi:hypothetical protein